MNNSISSNVTRIHHSTKNLTNISLPGNMSVEQPVINNAHPKDMSKIKWLVMPKLDNLTDVFSTSCSAAVIFGGLVPYIPQYLTIKRSMSTDGFSTYANILRIMFWFGHPFEMALLIQSFVMIIGMLALMEICVRVRDSYPRTNMISCIGGSNSNLNASTSRRRTSLAFQGPHNFWDWDNFSSYIKFLVLFTTVMGLITYLLLGSSLYIECLGFVAVLTESMLGVPQLTKNYSKKSTVGMSVEMVIMWLSGDLFKTLYYFIKKTPTQFYICGSIQILVDILILVQVFWYRRSNATYSKLPKTT